MAICGVSLLSHFTVKRFLLLLENKCAKYQRFRNPQDAIIYDTVPPLTGQKQTSVLLAHKLRTFVSISTNRTFPVNKNPDACTQITGRVNMSLDWLCGLPPANSSLKDGPAATALRTCCSTAYLISWMVIYTLDDECIWLWLCQLRLTLGRRKTD